MDTVTSSTASPGKVFADLHAGAPFVMANPLDAGTAQFLHGQGCVALGTTSSGVARSRGIPDSHRNRLADDIINNAAEIIAATPLPVNVDMEDGFSDSAEVVAKTFASLVDMGAAGASLEDFSGRADDPIRPVGECVARLEAVLDAVRQTGQPFTVTARAEGYLYGQADLADVVARLQAFADAGADVVYAPGLPDAESIQVVCEEVDRPVNVLLGVGHDLNVEQLFELGVHRVSLGTALSEAARVAVELTASAVLTTGALPTK